MDWKYLELGFSTPQHRARSNSKRGERVTVFVGANFSKVEKLLYSGVRICEEERRNFIVFPFFAVESNKFP